MNRQIQGLVPPVVTWVADNIAVQGNVFGTSKTERAKWAEDLNLHKRGETIFLLGVDTNILADWRHCGRL